MDADTHTDSATRNILVIDADSRVCGYVSKLLARFGCSVVCVGSATEGINRIKEDKWEMIVSELNLPDVPDEDAFLGELIDASAEMPLVIVSEFSGEELDGMVTQGYITAYLSKPFELPFLKHILRDLQEEL